MARRAGLSPRAGAWTLVAWAAAVAVATPATRLAADAHGFAVKRMVEADVALVAYALLAAAFAAVQLRRGKAGPSLAWLTGLPLVDVALASDRFSRFGLDTSGYPFVLAALHWLGNLAVLALAASAVLLLLSDKARPGPSAVAA